jgi:hypothetical protein
VKEAQISELQGSPGGPARADLKVIALQHGEYSAITVCMLLLII